MSRIWRNRSHCLAVWKIKNQKVVQRFLRSFFRFLVLPSPGFLIFTLAGCLVYWTVSALFSRFQPSTRSLPSSRSLQTQISLFFVLFHFFIYQLYCNSLSTENLIVRTDDLLYSREQILKTEKEFCFFEISSSSELDFLKNIRTLVHQKNQPMGKRK